MRTLTDLGENSSQSRSQGRTGMTSRIYLGSSFPRSLPRPSVKSPQSSSDCLARHENCDSWSGLLGSEIKTSMGSVGLYTSGQLSFLQNEDD